MSAPLAKQRTRRRNEIETRNLAPVQDAVREYRVIEDGAYAHSLQEQEIENHYSQNVNVRRTVQEDIRAAKELQDEEDRRAKIKTLDEEDEVRQMDEELAEMIQEQIFTESTRQERERKEWEERDKEIALLLEEKERRKAVELARRDEERDHHIAKQMERVSVSSPESDDGRRMRVMSDKELAKRLQMEEKLKIERDEKRRRELKSVVELQDEELAKFIHEKDIEKAEHIYRKTKKKMKGRHRNDPLYYDDNFDNPPDYHSAVADPKPAPPKEHRMRMEDNQRDRHDRSRHHEKHRHSQPPIDQGKSRRHPPPYDERDDRMRSHHEQRRSNDRPRSEHKPNRPPPPAFDSRHVTEVKEPLDDRQRRHRERNQQANRRSSGEDFDRSRHHDHHRHPTREGGNRGGSSGIIENEPTNSRSHRSGGDRVHKSTPSRSGKSITPRDDLPYNEEFADIAAEDMGTPNNNLSRKQRKSKSDCKQQ